MFVYSRAHVQQVLRLVSTGAPVAEVARVHGVSPRTIRRWMAGQTPKRDSTASPSPSPSQIAAQHPEAFAYLLGLYLGDGHLARMRRGVYALRITLDSKYMGLVEECACAVRAVMPANRVATRPHAGGHRAVIVSCLSKRWPELFPQHGPGFKHTRPIFLADWQWTITRLHPEELIRGLIHSDGCRFTARQRMNGRTYEYARYCFSNRSRGILKIFCDHLDALDIRWTMSSPEQVQIARKEHVRRLDEFVGPKRKLQAADLAFEGGRTRKTG